MCTSMLALPKMSSIDTLIAAAKFIEENERASPPQTPQQPPAAAAIAPPLPLPQPPPQPPQVQQPPPQPAQHLIQQSAPAATVVLHQVVQQAQPALTVAPPPPPPQPQAIPAFQQVTIQHAHTNGHGHIITAQPMSAIRIHKKADVVSVTPGVNRLTVMNSFDLINPAVIDQSSGEVKRKQPPIAFRTGTREVHNKLEKNRRAHLKDCFDDLNATLMNSRDAVKKTSNLNILDSALQCIKDLQREADASELEIEKLAKEKISLQQRYSSLMKDIKSMYNVDVPDMSRIEDHMRPKRTHRHLEKLQVKQEVQETTATTTMTTAGAMVTAAALPAVLRDRTPPLTTGGTTTISTTLVGIGGSMLKLPKSISSNGTTVTAAAAAAATTKDSEVAVAAVPAAAAAAAPTTAYTFGIHQLPVVGAANGGLVLQKVLVPKSLTAASADGHHHVHHHHHHHQLTAQFVSAHHHHHHHHLPVVGAAGGDSKVIVNAQYVVKPLVVVSTPSRPS